MSAAAATAIKKVEAIYKNVFDPENSTITVKNFNNPDMYDSLVRKIRSIALNNNTEYIMVLDRAGTVLFNTENDSNKNTYDNYIIAAIGPNQFAPAMVLAKNGTYAEIIFSHDNRPELVATKPIIGTDGATAGYLKYVLK